MVARGKGRNVSSKPQSSAPTNSRPHTGGDTGSAGGSAHTKRISKSDSKRVWGESPKAARSQSDLIELFSRQNELKARLAKQARLLKIAVAEVRSTEVERLRMVNQAILDVSSGVKGFVNPFTERNLTDVQLRAEDMIRRQGVKQLGGQPRRKETPPSPVAFRNRRKWASEVSTTNPRTPPTKALGRLGGPLARSYLRSVERGYLGSPESWIRGDRAVLLAAKLSQKGFSFPQPDQWSLCDYRSPVYWVVNCHSGIDRHNLRHGFQGERLRSVGTNYSVLRRQAASVQRLKRCDWPLVPGTKDYAWPNAPTLNESWTMMRRGHSPIHHNYDPVLANVIRKDKVPTKQVKPGSSARAIANFVIGIRADIEMPRNFLGYFRYRWGFLILRRKGFLPRLLVKRLADIWKRDCSGMFLKVPVRYNEALRRIPSTMYYMMLGFVPAGKLPTPGRKGRSRQGRHERLRKKISDVIPPVYYTGGSPSSDKSDGGVRLR